MEMMTTASLPIVDIKRNILQRTIYSPISYTLAVMEREQTPVPDVKSPVLTGLIKQFILLFTYEN